MEVFALHQELNVGALFGAGLQAVAEAAVIVDAHVVAVAGHHVGDVVVDGRLSASGLKDDGLDLVPVVNGRDIDAQIDRAVGIACGHKVQLEHLVKEPCGLVVILEHFLDKALDKLQCLNHVATVTAQVGEQCLAIGVTLAVPHQQVAGLLGSLRGDVGQIVVLQFDVGAGVDVLDLVNTLVRKPCDASGTQGHCAHAQRQQR